MDARQKITIAHNCNLRTKQRQRIVLMAIGVIKLYQSEDAITIHVTGTAHDMKIICIARRRFMKVKYFKGFATAMYRSCTKLHKFVADAYSNSHLIKAIASDNRPCESHPLVIE